MADENPYAHRAVFIDRPSADRSYQSGIVILIPPAAHFAQHQIPPQPRGWTPS